MPARPLEHKGPSPALMQLRQPLWAEDNIRKGAKMPNLLETYQCQ